MFMSDVLKAKLRKIGSSVGILIPQERLAALDVAVGDEVEIALLKHRNEKDIEKMFGIAKRTKPFVRDKTSREFSC